MSSITPVLVFHSLNVNRGGLTNAVMTRANTLADHFDNVLIFTFFYQRKHRNINKKLCDVGKLDKRVTVYNMFNDLNPFSSESDLASNNEDESGFSRKKDTSAKALSYKVYKNGVYVKYERYDGKNLEFVDHFDEQGIRTHREEYNEKGDLARIRYMDPETNKVVSDSYVHKDGRCYLTVEWNPETGKEGKCRLFYPKPMDFKNPEALCAYWITGEIESVESPVLMADSQHSYEMLLNIPSQHAKRVVTLHNNHYKNGKLRGHLKPLFRNVDKYDGLVLLTDEQKEDVVQEFGELQNIFVIPHGAKIPEKKDYVKRDRYLAVTLARLESQKRLEEAIKAFRHVVKQVPKARYEIYGSGSEKEKLQKVINRLRLQKHVKLMGYTNQSAREYKRATCMILTSAYEGSPLVMYECMAVGTPVVSYKTKYGPKDLIREGLDGYLVDYGDRRRLADKIVQLMKKRKIRKEMSAHTTDVLERFSFQKYEENWVNLVKQLGSQVLEEAK